MTSQESWVLIAVQVLLILAWLRNNQKLHALDDATIADLRGQIDRMMRTAVDSDAGDRLWAARRPNGACARKLAVPPPSPGCQLCDWTGLVMVGLPDEANGVPCSVCSTEVSE